MSKTVLYVEDNEFNRKIVRQLLTVTTYRLLEATDGDDTFALDGQITFDAGSAGAVVERGAAENNIGLEGRLRRGKNQTQSK